MNVIKTSIDGVVIIEPKAVKDGRGWFSEIFRSEWFAANVRDTRFVQDNEVFSCYGVLRGLHYQMPPYAQSKLVRVTSGRILDVAVDMRKGSPTFGRHVAVELSCENHRQLFVPRGFAHGYAVLSETSVVQYKCDNYYSPEHEAALAYNDPAVGIDWLLPAEDVLLSDKDGKSLLLADAGLFCYGDELY